MSFTEQNQLVIFTLLDCTLWIFGLMPKVKAERCWQILGKDIETVVEPN